MKQLICEVCGSADLIKKDGVFVCQACGCKYSVEEARKMMIEGTVSIDGVVKTRNDDFEVRAGELIAYHGAETNIVIPDGIKIIGEKCFSGMEGIESVIIPEGVYEIKNEAFSGCKGLKKVVFPKSLDRILDSAFHGCYALIELEFPREEVHIFLGSSCFSSCGLKSVRLPDGIQTIGDYCFSFCTSLISIDLPDSIQTIGKYCFAGCTSLELINLPDSIQTIEGYCFAGCTSLKSINLPDSIHYLGDGCFSGYTFNESWDLPDSDFNKDKPIKNGCTALKSIHLPDSIQTIGKYCFAGCTALESINLPDSIQTIGEHCFSSCTSLKSVIIHDSIQTIKGIQTIENYCFSDCTSLKSIHLPDSIQTIKVACFSGCTSLESIHISNSIQKISFCAFSNTPTLRTIEVPASFIDACKPEDIAHMAYDDYNDGKFSISSPWFKDAYEMRRSANQGCYIATAVYGSYDCPQVWTLRRYRDFSLAKSWFGRLFVHAYYAVSPTLVKWFGNTNWFKKMWKVPLDQLVKKLHEQGIEDSPYEDTPW